MTTTRFVGRDPANATRTAGAAQIPAAAPSRQAAPWRDLFRFRAPTRPDIEVWVGIAAFASVLGAWLLVTELGLINPQFLPLAPCGGARLAGPVPERLPVRHRHQRRPGLGRLPGLGGARHSARRVDEQLSGGRGLFRAADRLHPLFAGARARAAHADLARYREGSNVTLYYAAQHVLARFAYRVRRCRRGLRIEAHRVCQGRAAQPRPISRSIRSRGCPPW